MQKIIIEVEQRQNYFCKSFCGLILVFIYGTMQQFPLISREVYGAI